MGEIKYRARAYVEFEVELPDGYEFLNDLDKKDIEQQLLYNISNHLHYAGHKKNDFSQEKIFSPTHIKIKDASVNVDKPYRACPWCTMPNGEHEFECPYGGNGVK